MHTTTTRQWRLLVRALPSVAAWQPVAAAGVLAGAFVVSAASPSAALMRLRVGGALIAAGAAFVIDDAAAVTLASVPTTLGRRRVVRIGAALAAIFTWWVAVAAVADARTGSGRPPAFAVIESMVLALLGIAVGALALRLDVDSARSAGGSAGLAVVLFVFAGSFLPVRWWPLAADPAGRDGVRRLVGVLTVAIVLVAVASADPARRLPVRRSLRSAH